MLGGDEESRSELHTDQPQWKYKISTVYPAE